jgi:hypothetical protein
MLICMWAWKILCLLMQESFLNLMVHGLKPFHPYPFYWALGWASNWINQRICGYAWDGVFETFL